MDILDVYGWWQFGVCLFAFAGLMAIWYHLGRRQKDHGQVWLALSVLCWSCSGLVDVITGQSTPLWADGARSIFSLLNSLFILLALPWFRYLPDILRSVIRSKYWLVIVGLPFVFSLLPTLSKMFFGNPSGIISELDVYYSILTLLFLGLVLWESFARRRLQMLAWLSVICILITFIAQLYKLTDQNVNLTLFSAIFKTCLIMIFFALALSWVKDVAERLNPIGSQLSISLGHKVFNGQSKRITQIYGVIPHKSSALELSNAQYDLLYKFAERKLLNEGWLVIKPKSMPWDPEKHDIKDHNQIKRLSDAILDGIFGKGNWNKEQHEEPFKAALYEYSDKRDRRIRLRVAKDQIEVK